MWELIRNSRAARLHHRWGHCVLQGSCFGLRNFNSNLNDAENKAVCPIVLPQKIPVWHWLNGCDARRLQDCRYFPSRSNPSNLVSSFLLCFWSRPQRSLRESHSSALSSADSRSRQKIWTCQTEPDPEAALRCVIKGAWQESTGNSATIGQWASSYNPQMKCIPGFPDVVGRPPPCFPPSLRSESFADLCVIFSEQQQWIQTAFWNAPLNFWTCPIHITKYRCWYRFVNVGHATVRMRRNLPRPERTQLATEKIASRSSRWFERRPKHKRPNAATETQQPTEIQWPKCSDWNTNKWMHKLSILTIISIVLIN